MSKPADRKTKAATKLKEEKESPRANRGFLNGLFDRSAKKGGELVAAKPAQSGQKPAQPKVDPIRLQETLLTPRRPKHELTSPSKLQAKLQKIDVRQSAKASAAKAKPRDKSTHGLRVVLFALLFLIVGLGVFESWKAKLPPPIDAQAAAADLAALEVAKDRVAFHRGEVGRRLNRDRIDVQIQNAKTAPQLPHDARPVQARDMMEGLPLAVEQTHRPSSRDRLEALNPDFADARVMYNLREQQSANDTNDSSREQYVREFIANAARAGYKVKVDENGVVQVLGVGAPSRDPATGSRGNNGVPAMAQ